MLSSAADRTNPETASGLGTGCRVPRHTGMNRNQQPLHFHELTRLYNQRMQPHSRKGSGYILRVLNLMHDAQRVEGAVYQLKSR